MKKMLLLATAIAFAMSASAAGPAAFSAGTGVKSGDKPGLGPLAILYDQNSDDNGIGIVSQNFEGTFDAYDAQGADDFTVPAGQKWKVTGISPTGVYFNGAGPASSWHVSIYTNRRAKPFEVVCDAPEIICACCGAAQETSGCLIVIPGQCTLKPGKYWVSVLANMDFGVGGEWGWETRNTQAGVAAKWQNPGGGFGTGCDTYADMRGCIGDLGQGPDYMFSLAGRIK